MKTPAFQFYPSDFVTGRVATYDAEHIGVYVMLLSYDWLLDGLPLDATDKPQLSTEKADGKPRLFADDGNSDVTCSKLSRNSVKTLSKLSHCNARVFARIWKKIHIHFALCADGKLRNPRLQVERQKQLGYSLAMSANGKLGGRPKKPKLSNRKADGKPTKSFSSSSSTSVEDQEITTLSNSTFDGSANGSNGNGSAPASSPTSDVEAVLAHYCKAHPRRRVGPKDRKAVTSALKLGYSAQDLMAAIDGNASDQWHRDRRKHELPYVLRDTGHIDNFIALKPDVDMSNLISGVGELTLDLDRLSRQ